MAYETAMSGRRTAERAAETKREAEREIGVPGRGLNVRQANRFWAAEEAAIKAQPPREGLFRNVPPTGTGRPPWGAGLPSLEELRGTPGAISDVLALRRGVPSPVRRAYEETAAGTVAGGPTILGFGAGLEGALPPIRATAGAILARGGRAGEVLEAAPGLVGRAGKQAFLEATARVKPATREFLANFPSQAGRLAREEAGAVGPLGRGGRLTGAAEELLKMVDEGRVPESYATAALTQRMKQVARENGIEVTAGMTPNDLVDALRAKTGALIEAAPTPAQAPRVPPPEAAVSVTPREPTRAEVLAQEKGMILSNDIPARAEIDSRMREVANKLGTPRTRGKAELEREFATLQAQRDIDNIRRQGIPLDDQMSAVMKEREAIETELRRRSIPFGGAASMRGKTARATAARAAATRNDYPALTTAQLDARQRVFAEFEENFAIRPGTLKPLGGKVPEEPLVTGTRQYGKEPEVMRGTLFWGPERTGATEGGLQATEAQGTLGLGETPLPDRLAANRVAKQATQVEGNYPVRPTAGTEAQMRAAEEAFVEPPITPAEGVRAGAEPPAGARPPTAGGFAEYEAAGAEDDLMARLADWQSQKPPGGKPPRAPRAAAEPPAPTPESAGNRFVAPLRDLDEVASEVVTSENPIVRTLVGRTGINPSVLRDTEAGRILTAYQRQRVSADELTQTALVAALDTHAQPVTGLKLNFHTDKVGLVSNVPVGEGQSRAWWDIFSRYKDYTLTRAQTAEITDYLQVVREVEEMRVAAGLKPRAMTKEGWFYVPRQVKGLRGIELRRPSDPGLQRVYDEAQEGIAKGVDYVTDRRATLEIHVRNAYREILEKQLSDAIEPLSVGPKELIPEPVRIRMEQATRNRVTAERQLRTLKREYLKEAQKGKAGWPKREAKLETMRSQMDAQQARINEARSAFATSKNAYRRSMEAARKAEIAPGRLFGRTEEAIPVASWRNRFLPREDADVLKEALGAWLRPEQKAGVLVRGVEILGNYVRFLSAVGDFALPGIHGLPVAGRRADVWARGTAGHYVAFLDPTVQARFVKDHLPTFQKMAQYGTPIGDPEFFAALTREGGVSPGRLLKMLPGGKEARTLLQQAGKQTFGRFQASYNTGLSMYRGLLYEALRPKWAGTEAEIWAYIRNMTGGLDSRALGVGPSQRGLESMWLAFSPRLLRSTGALIVNSAKLGTPGGRESFRSLAQLAVAATGLFVMVGLALGKSREDIEKGLNPTAGKKFLSHEINGDWIGIGGQVRGITQMLAGIASTAKGGDMENFVSTNQFDNPVLGFWTSRGAPAYNIVGGLVEVGTGANVLPFDNVDSLPDLARHIGTSALPFAIQGVLEGQQWGTSLAGLVGFRTSAGTPFEELNRLVPGWDKMPDPQRKQEAAKNPKVAAAWAKQVQQGVSGGQEWAELRTRFEKEDASFGAELLAAMDNPQGRTAKDFMEAVGDHLRDTAIAKQEAYGQRPQQDSRSERERAMDEYDALELGRLPTPEQEDQFFSKREAMLKADPQLATDIRERQALRFKDPKVQALVRQRFDAQQVRSELYAIPAKVGMTTEEEARIRPYLSELYARTKMGGSQKLALYEMDIPDDLLYDVLAYLRLPSNPDRRAFKDAHPELMWYEDIPYEDISEEAELELAGVR